MISLFVDIDKREFSPMAFVLKFIAVLINVYAMIKIISKSVETICKRLLMRYNHKNASVFSVGGRRSDCVPVTRATPVKDVRIFPVFSAGRFSCRRSL